MDGYVSKNDIKPLMQAFDLMLSYVRRDAKARGLTFTCDLVGSAKRNLVVAHPTKGIDCDYQLHLQSNKNELDAEQIKKIFCTLFDKYRPQGFSYCEDSTSSLTMKMKDKQHCKILCSFDIVLLRNLGGVPEIIRRNTDGKYVWNKLRYMSDFQERFSLITGNEMWNELKERYYKKKVKQMNGNDDKKSFQLLNEAVNEVLQVYAK